MNEYKALVQSLIKLSFENIYNFSYCKFLTNSDLVIKVLVFSIETKIEKKIEEKVFVFRSSNKEYLFFHRWRANLFLLLTYFKKSTDKWQKFEFKRSYCL